MCSFFVLCWPSEEVTVHLLLTTPRRENCLRDMLAKGILFTDSAAIISASET
jgi:hypothetical protein